MTEKERSAESSEVGRASKVGRASELGRAGKFGRAGSDPHDGPPGRDRSPTRWLVWVALVLAIVVAAICWNSGDDPEVAEPVGQPAEGEVSETVGQSAEGEVGETVGQPAGGDPSDCYTTEADQPHPRDTNRYVVALTAGDAGAGALDEYAHCKYLPAQNPAAADPDCYSTGDDNERHLVGVNRHALALLDAGASAGALDKYAGCAYLPAVLDSAEGR